MTRDALGTAGGVADAVDHRLAIGGTFAVQGPTVLDARTGVLVGPGAAALVTGTSATGTMTVGVAPFHAVTARNAAGGLYLGPTQEAATTVNIAAAPGANSRIDVVWVKQQDADATVLTPDGSTAPLLSVTTGTAAASPTKPAIPVGALELATVTVAAGATSTNGAGVTIANTARLTAARGAMVYVRNATEEAALTAYDGLLIYRADFGQIKVFISGVARTVYDPSTPTSYYNAGAGTSTNLTTTPTVPTGGASLAVPAGTFDVDIRGYFTLSVSTAATVISLYLYNGSTQLFSTDFAIMATGGVSSRAHADFTRITLASAATLTIRAGTSATGGTQSIAANAIRARVA